MNVVKAREWFRQRWSEVLFTVTDCNGWDKFVFSIMIVCRIHNNRSHWRKTILPFFGKVHVHEAQSSVVLQCVTASHLPLFKSLHRKELIPFNQCFIKPIKMSIVPNNSFMQGSSAITQSGSHFHRGVMMPSHSIIKRDYRAHSLPLSLVRPRHKLRPNFEAGD